MPIAMVLDILYQQQDPLITSQSPIKIDGVVLRPFITRKALGNLNAHSNGFRYTSKQSVVDIIYSNIKQAFFQPAENNLIVLIHLHLKNEILVGNRAVKDIQFFKEVANSSQVIDDKGYYGHEAEIEAEERERKQINQTNQRFKEYVIQVQKIAKDFNFEIPNLAGEETTFYGCHHKDKVKIYLTLNCLVNLLEPPFLVICNNDIEIVYFERVHFNIKQFDMTIVFQDWTISCIRAIDSESIDILQRYFDEKKYKIL